MAEHALRWWLRRYAPWIFFVSTTSCSQGNTFHVDNAFSADERAALSTAVDDMASRTGSAPIDLIFDGDLSAAQRIVKMPPAQTNCRGAVDATSGCFHVKDGEVVIYIGELGASEFARVARHEIGHHYGMEHHVAPGIMSPYADADWDDADLVECRRIGLCGTK